MSEAPLTNETRLSWLRQAAESDMSFCISQQDLFALVECAEALTVTRGQWIHSVNAPRCLAALAKLEVL